MLRKWTSVLYLTLVGSLLGFSCPRSSSAERGFVEQPSEIPFELYNDSLIVVKGTIESRENAKILLDTGTITTAISTEIAERLNLRGNTQQLLSLNGKIDVQTVILKRIDIGALHLRSARVVVQDLSLLQRRLGMSIDAIAGLDVLSTGRFLIDYRKQRIVFAPTKAPRRSVRFETRRPALTVKANIDGCEVRLLVDSGTPTLLLFRKRLKTGLARLEPLPNVRDAPMFTATTGTMRAAWFRASQVWIGNESIGSQVLLMTDADPDRSYEFEGLLGLANAGFQQVWLDFENGLFGWD